METFTAVAEGRIACCRMTTDDEFGPSPMIAVGVNSAVQVFHGKTPKVTVTGLTTPTSAVALDRQARRIAAGSEGGSLRLWDTATGESIQGFSSTHRTAVTSLDYHPFAEFMASASRDTHVRVWDLRKKSCLQVYKHKDGVAAPIEVVRVAPDGLTAASGCSEGAVRLYDLRGGKPRATLNHHGAPISSLCFHPSRQMLAACSEDGVVSVWDIEETKLVFSSDETGAQHVAVLEGWLFACAPNVVKRWGVPTFSPAQPKPIRTGGTVVNVHVGAQGTVHVAGANDGMLNVTSFPGRSSGTAATGGAKRAATSGVHALRQQAEARAKATASAPSKAPAGGSGGVPPPRVGGASAAAVGGRSPPVARHSPRGSPAESQPPAHHQRPLGEVVPPVPQAQQFAAPAEPTPKAVARAPAPQPQRKREPPPSAAAENAGALPALPGVDLDELDRRGETMTSLMERRATHLRMLRTAYQRRVEEAVTYANQLLKADETSDSGAVVDLVEAIGHFGRVTDRVTLESLPAVLTLAEAILSRHKQVRYVAAAIEMARVLWARFSTGIRDVVRGAKISAGVDLSMETRLEKANAAMKQFDLVKSRALGFVGAEDEAGEAARKFIEAYTI